MTSSTWRYALVLGFLSALGVSALDIYLPSLPAITADFQTDANTAQLSLTSYFLAMAATQVIYGPLSDMVGRRLPILVGLTIYMAGAIGSAMSPDIHFLIGMRFIQGIGAGAGAVVARAVVRDLYTGAEAARLMSMLMLVFSISPLLAPLAGSVIVSMAGWQEVFWAMALFGVIGFLLVLTLLEETRPLEKRLESSVGTALRNYLFLFRDPYFLGIVGISAFGMSSYMLYISNSSFVLMEHFGLSPSAYGLAFGINALPFFVMSQLNGRLVRRFGLRRVIRAGVFAYSSIMVAHLAVRSSGIDSFPVMAAFLFCGYGFLGIVMPTTFVLALEAHGAIAGTASALMGTLQFVAAAIVTGVVSRFFDGTSMPMIAGIATCATIVLMFTLATLRPRTMEAAAARAAAE